MLEYKKRILLREFSFLDKVLEKAQIKMSSVGTISIKKVDENLLGIKGRLDTSNFPYSKSGAFVRDSGKQYFAVNGEEIYEIPSEGLDESQYERNRRSADTVGEELIKAGIKPQFIVLFDFCFTQDDDAEDYCNLIIYKAKSFDLLGYHASNLRKAARELEDELRATEE